VAATQPGDLIGDREPVPAGRRRAAEVFLHATQWALGGSPQSTELKLTTDLCLPQIARSGKNRWSNHRNQNGGFGVINPRVLELLARDRPTLLLSIDHALLDPTKVGKAIGVCCEPQAIYGLLRSACPRTPGLPVAREPTSGVTPRETYWRCALPFRRCAPTRSSAAEAEAAAEARG